MTADIRDYKYFTIIAKIVDKEASKEWLSYVMNGKTLHGTDIERIEVGDQSGRMREALVKVAEVSSNAVDKSRTMFTNKKYQLLTRLDVCPVCEFNMERYLNETSIPISDDGTLKVVCPDCETALEGKPYQMVEFSAIQ